MTCWWALLFTSIVSRSWAGQFMFTWMQEVGLILSPVWCWEDRPDRPSVCLWPLLETSTKMASKVRIKHWWRVWCVMKTLMCDEDSDVRWRHWSLCVRLCSWGSVSWNRQRNDLERQQWGGFYRTEPGLTLNTPVWWQSAVGHTCEPVCLSAGDQGPCGLSWVQDFWILFVWRSGCWWQQISRPAGWLSGWHHCSAQVPQTLHIQHLSGLTVKFSSFKSLFKSQKTVWSDDTVHLLPAHLWSTDNSNSACNGVGCYNQAAVYFLFCIETPQIWWYHDVSQWASFKTVIRQSYIHHWSSSQTLLSFWIFWSTKLL